MDNAEREAFDKFVRARGQALLRFGTVLTGGNAHAAADLVQDALERTWLAWSRVLDKQDPEAYIRRAMVNRHVSVWRHLRRERLVAEAPEGEAAPAEPYDREIWQALAALPPRMRAIVVLRFYEDLDEAATAQVLGCSLGTVKSTTSRALARLRVDWADPPRSTASQPPDDFRLDVAPDFAGKVAEFDA